MPIFQTRLSLQCVFFKCLAFLIPVEQLSPRSACFPSLRRYQAPRILHPASDVFRKLLSMRYVRCMYNRGHPSFILESRNKKTREVSRGTCAREREKERERGSTIRDHWINRPDLCLAIRHAAVPQLQSMPWKAMPRPIVSLLGYPAITRGLTDVPIFLCQ